MGQKMVSQWPERAGRLCDSLLLGLRHSEGCGRVSDGSPVPAVRLTGNGWKQGNHRGITVSFGWKSLGRLFRSAGAFGWTMGATSCMMPTWNPSRPNGVDCATWTVSKEFPWKAPQLSRTCCECRIAVAL
jgi:hypothetical protein